MPYYLFGSLVGASVLISSKGLTEEQLVNAVILDELPIPEIIEGKYSQINCNNETKEVWYDYYDIPTEE